MNNTDAKEYLANKVSTDPTLRSAINDFVHALKAFHSALYALILVVRNSAMSLDNDRFKTWLRGRNAQDVFLGFVLSQAIRYATDDKFTFASFMAGFSRIKLALSDYFKAVEIDQPTPGFEESAVVYPRPEVKRFKETGPSGATVEAMQPNTDIRATGLSHDSFAVRLFSLSNGGAYSYVGMGVRISEEEMMLPYHVAIHLKEGFKMKGANRNVVTLEFDQSLIVRQSVENDFIIYRAGKVAFTRTGTSKAKFRPLQMEKRVFIRACVDGTEHGSVSEGIPTYSPFNDSYYADYSSVAGHSGAPILQLENRNHFLVGMHTNATADKNQFLGVYYAINPITDFNESSTMSSSSVSQDSEEKRYTLRVRAAMYVEQKHKEARMRGDHRFDDGVVEDEWALANANEAAAEFSRNKEEFAENFAYVKGKGWHRKRGGKAKGGVMIYESKEPHQEAAAAAQALSLLKGRERVCAPLKEVSAASSVSETQPESMRTSSKTMTSPDSEGMKQKTMEQESSASVEPTRSLCQSIGIPQRELDDLISTLKASGLSKKKLRDLVAHLPASIETSSTQPTSSATPPEEQNRS